jgi:homoserine kinase
MPQRIKVRIPATSANLGCAFDCAAIALALYLEIEVTPRSDANVTITYRGVTPERISTGEDNLIARTIRQTLKEWGCRRGFDLEIHNNIPVGIGLGSSAAAIVGALAACHWLGHQTLYDEELLARATSIEGHPDNVAAAWHGGFTITVQRGERVLAYSAPVPDTLQLVLVIPSYAVPTEKARAVLPEHYERAAAVHNLQRAAALVAQVFSGKADFHPTFFDDRLHQPYRAALMPGLVEVLALKHPHLAGVCLSGAGPSILAFARGDAEDVGGLITRTLSQKGVESQVHILSSDNTGAKGWNLPA